MGYRLSHVHPLKSSGDLEEEHSHRDSKMSRLSGRNTRRSPRHMSRTGAASYGLVVFFWFFSFSLRADFEGSEKMGPEASSVGQSGRKRLMRQTC